MRYEEENLRKLVSESNSFSEVTRKLGLKPHCGNRQTVKNYITKYNIDTSHFGNYYEGRGDFGNRGKPIEGLLVENSTYNHTTNLKNKLYKVGLKKRECELCGQGEKWRGKKMSLILDHINGVNNDNRIENLRIVCPNCNATLPTHGGLNTNVTPTKNERKKYKNKKNKCECGEMKSPNAKLCLKCDSVKQRTVERPDHRQLLNEIKELGYLGTGRKYGVSDNTIRKWKKFYEKIN